jgi:hypothetical protein
MRKKSRSLFIAFMVLFCMSIDMHGAVVVDGQGGWLFFEPELRHLSSGRFWGEDAASVGRASQVDARDPLPAILDFHRSLQQLGVELLLVPVPPKAVVYGSVLPGGEARSDRWDPHLQAFYEVLRSEGVRVLDLTDAFIAARDGENGLVYCQTDTHWSGVGCVLAAQQIAPAIVEHVGTGSQVFETAWREIEIAGDIGRMQPAVAVPQERLSVRAVVGDTIDAESPVLVLGDSHTLVFHSGGDMHYSRAGLVDQLAHVLGMPVDLIGVRGSGATPARINLFRRVRQNADFWNQKRVVVWVFAAREFTDSDGWRIVPMRVPVR